MVFSGGSRPGSRATSPTCRSRFAVSATVALCGMSSLRCPSRPRTSCACRGGTRREVARGPADRGVVMSVAHPGKVAAPRGRIPGAASVPRERGVIRREAGSSARSASVKSENVVTARPSSAGRDDCHHRCRAAIRSAPSFSIEPHDTTSTRHAGTRGTTGITSDLDERDDQDRELHQHHVRDVGEDVAEHAARWTHRWRRPPARTRALVLLVYSARMRRNTPVHPVRPRISTMVMVPLCCSTAATAKMSSG